MKKSHAHRSGMRGAESAPTHDEKAPVTEMPGQAPAFASGMRAGEKPQAEGAQAIASSVEQGLQPGTNLEGVAQGVEPPTIQDGGDHYLITHKIPKANVAKKG